MREALDRCLARLRQGDTIEACLADCADLAEELRPLLVLAVSLLDDVPAPPSVPLAGSRARFLDAAARSREADARSAELLDRCVQSAVAGAPTVVPSPDAAPEAPALLAFARMVATDVVATPAPPHGLAVGRRRMLASAAQHRARVAPPRSDWRAALRSWFAPAAPSLAPRLMAVAVCVLVLFFAGNVVVAPRVAAAIPGDALYGWKLLGEELRLTFTFDPAERARLAGSFSRERARELVAASQMGRSEELTWHVRLVRFDRNSESDSLQGTIVVATLADTEGVTTTWRIDWDEDTKWVVPSRYEGMSEVPPGSRLRLRLRTRGPDEPPLLLVAVVLADDEPDATGTATVGAETATAPPDQSTSTALPATGTASPTVAATATPTRGASAATPVTSTAYPPTTATAAPVGSEEAEEQSLLTGIVKSTGSASWQVADDGQSGRLVAVDVTRLDAADRERVRPEDWVRLVGRWMGHSTFVADDLDAIRPWESRCVNRDATGEVVEFTPGSWLKLSTGQGFRLSGASAVESSVGAGAQVRVVWLDCGSGDIRVTQVTVLRSAGTDKATGTPAPRGPIQGIVRAVVDDATFVLAADNGSELTVRYGKGVSIYGAATEIREGQEVGVWGWLEGKELRADRIEVYVDAAPATPTAAVTPGSNAATAEPSATPTDPPNTARS